MPSMANQENWRWCTKCQGIAFAGNPSIGACAGGGQHDHNGSGNYTLPLGAGAAGQPNWRWCRKCQCLSFAGNATAGACAAGGQHSHEGSGNYTLALGNGSAPGQHNWRWCSKCEGLAFAVNASIGVCPARRKHDEQRPERRLRATAGRQISKLRQWRLPALSAGKVDFHGGTLLIRSDGAWQCYGSLHDNSFWYGDNWAWGFVMGTSGAAGPPRESWAPKSRDRL